MGKRKRSSVVEASKVDGTNTMLPPPMPSGKTSGRSSQRKPSINEDVLDAPDALRASPDSDVVNKITPGKVKSEDDSDSPLSDVPEEELESYPKLSNAKQKRGASAKTKSDKTPTKADKHPNKNKDDELDDPEADEAEEEAKPEEIREASRRPPPVNSDFLPLPWKGRIGYACLCTYLRAANPPVFCSRTTRISSILEHRHPLADPSQPEHPTKNRPDKDKPADPARGQKFVENLCLQNVRDMAKLIRWNDKFGIKFLRLSSEAFPFASHAEYGYRLAPFAAEELARVGKVAAELGHRLTTHPGQFTQLGSPKQNVIDASIRDLEYHDEMLSLLKLPEQQNRDAVMILHMGGVFGDKAATLDRFRENYGKLPDSIKKRLVLENDDVSYTVHDLLPICQELNIPLVLDYHHHNILFDSDKIREGTKDIMDLYPQILETWRRKGITPKMHYSEQTPPAITPKQRRKHSPRVATLPPCPQDMDLMIEAKDKEQAVFELMRTFKLPGYERINDVIPHVRIDENTPVKPAQKRATPKKKGKNKDEDLEDDAASIADTNADAEVPAPIPEDELNMGGPDGRVYWPTGMEEWLRPVKRVIKKKDPSDQPAAKLTPAQRKIIVSQVKAELAAEMAAKKNKVSSGSIEGDTAIEPEPQALAEAAAKMNAEVSGTKKKPTAKSVSKAAPKTRAKGPKTKPEPIPESTEEESGEDLAATSGKAAKRRKSARASQALKRSYKEEDEDAMKE